MYNTAAVFPSLRQDRQCVFDAYHYSDSDNHNLRAAVMLEESPSNPGKIVVFGITVFSRLLHVS